MDVAVEEIAETKTNLLQRRSVHVTICALFFVFYVVYTGTQYEDALITYRYAENITAGNGFVFNVGERVFGTTTPLYTLLLALLSKMTFLSVPLVSLILNVVFATASVLVVSRIVAHLNLSPSQQTAMVFLYGFHPVLAWHALSGMETGLLMLLMTAALYYFVVGKVGHMCAVFGLLFLTRYDSGIFSLVMFVTYLIYDRRLSLRPLLIPVLIVIPWLVFAYTYFGDVIPQSIRAKIQTAHSQSLFENLLWYGGGVLSSHLAVIVLTTILCVLGVRSMARSQAMKRMAIAVSTFIVTYAIFFIVGDAPLFFWYLAPITWGGFWLVGFGLLAVYDWLVQWQPRRENVVTGVAVFSFVSFLVLSNAFRAVQNRAVQENEDSLRMQAGLFISKNSNVQDRVAVEAIGYVGYYSQRSIIDLAGLVSPSVTSVRRKYRNTEEWFGEVWGGMKPEFIVLRSYETEQNRSSFGGRLFKDEAQQTLFSQTYEPVTKLTAIHADLWGRNASLSIYKRK